MSIKNTEINNDDFICSHLNVIICNVCKVEVCGCKYNHWLRRCINCIRKIDYDTESYHDIGVYVDNNVDSDVDDTPTYRTSSRKWTQPKEKKKKLCCIIL